MNENTSHRTSNVMRCQMNKTAVGVVSSHVLLAGTRLISVILSSALVIIHNGILNVSSRFGGGVLPVHGLARPLQVLRLASVDAIFRFTRVPHFYFARTSQLWIRLWFSPLKKIPYVPGSSWINGAFWDIIGEEQGVAHLRYGLK